MSQTLFTQCPNCLTVFRLKEQQLKVAKGKVRCGACFSVFNGEDMLCDESANLLNPDANNDELFDNQEAVGKDALLIDHIIPKEASQQHQDIDESFSNLEKGLDQLIDTKNQKDLPDSKLHAIKDELDDMSDELSRLNQSNKSSSTKNKDDDYDHPLIDDNVSLEDALADFDDSELEDLDLDDDLDGLFDDNTGITPKREKKPASPLPANPATANIGVARFAEDIDQDFSEEDLLPSSAKPAETKAKVVSKPPPAPAPSQPASIGIAKFEGDIDYEGYDDDDDLPAQESKSSSARIGPVEDKYSSKNTPDDAYKTDSSDDSALDDLEKLTQQLLNEVDKPSSKAKPKEKPQATKKASASSEKDLIDDLDAFTEELAKDVQARAPAPAPASPPASKTVEPQEKEPKVNRIAAAKQAIRAQMSSGGEVQNQEAQAPHEPEKQAQAESKAKFEQHIEDELQVSQLLSSKSRSPIAPIFWFVGSCVLAIGLYGQALVYNKENFAQKPTFRSHLELVCSLVKCQVPARKDLRYIKLARKSILPSRQNANELDVKLIIVNEAKFEQALPDIELIFTNQLGAVVATHLLKPEDYVLSSRKIKTIPANIEMQVRLKIEKPKEKYTGYELQFH